MTVIIGITALDLFLQAYFRSRGVGVANQGISFGWLPGQGWLVSMVIYLLFVAWFISEIIRGRLDYGLLAIGLGGLVNILPRMLLGGVWDYLSLPLLPFCFNLSDVLITSGVIHYIFEGNFLPARKR